MEIISWRAARLAKTDAGTDTLQTLSRTFSSRQTALAHAQLAGDGAFIKVVTAYVKDAKAALC